MNLIKRGKKLPARSMESLSEKNISAVHEQPSISPDFPDSNNLPVGPSAYYILDIRRNRFTYMDRQIQKIAGIPAEEFMKKKPAETIGDSTDPSHLESIAEFISKAFEMIAQNSDGADVSVTACIELNIITPEGKGKRIISQFYPVAFDKAGQPVIFKGRVVDISHIRNAGPPRLFMMGNNKIIYEETARPETVMKGEDMNLTKTEIQLIQLLSEGKTNKEIAERLNISILTLYTHRKNIRQKTKQDINRVISVLKSKGIID